MLDLMKRYLATYAFLNIFCLSLFAITYHRGWVEFTLKADTSYICLIIFVYLVLALSRITLTYAACYGRPNHDHSEKLYWCLQFIKTTSTNFLTLGLIGTLVGLTMALISIDISQLGNIQAMSEILSHFLGGVAVAWLTTLVGAFAWLWLRPIEYMTHKLYAEYKKLEVDSTSSNLDL